MKKTAIIFAILLTFLLTACAPTIRYKHRAKIEEEASKRFRDFTEVREEVTDTVEEVVEFQNIEYNPEVLETVIGLASFYADKFHGRTTANGETYDMYGFTAAHPDYPFGTIIKVTNLKNGKNTEIRVNDRMPKHPERLIDLSLGTAKSLDMVKDGVVEVKLEILKWGKQ